MHGRINSRSRVAYGEMQKQFIDSIAGPCGSHVEAMGNCMNQHTGNIVIFNVSSRENVSCNFFPLHPSRRGSVLYLVSTIWAGMIQFLPGCLWYDVRVQISRCCVCNEKVEYVG
ncbi:hypothetical protein V8C40DRAFT_67936 [Trichoderma camerunense]